MLVRFWDVTDSVRAAQSGRVAELLATGIHAALVVFAVVVASTTDYANASKTGFTGGTVTVGQARHDALVFDAALSSSALRLAATNSSALTADTQLPKLALAIRCAHCMNSNTTGLWCRVGDKAGPAQARGLVLLHAADGVLTAKLIARICALGRSTVDRQAPLGLFAIAIAVSTFAGQVTAVEVWISHVVLGAETHVASRCVLALCGLMARRRCAVVDVLALEARVARESGPASTYGLTVLGDTHGVFTA